MTKAKIHPFSTGSQYADWEDKNCFDCWKYRPKRSGGNGCVLSNALAEACIGEGTITQKIADRIGYDPNANDYTWDCPERERTKPAACNGYGRHWFSARARANGTGDIRPWCIRCGIDNPKWPKDGEINPLWRRPNK